LTNRLWALTVTPTRVGAGQRPGAVDLPLTRRRHTRIPYVPGSSVKGALRAHVETELESSDDLVDEILEELGEDTKERRERAVRILFGEGGEEATKGAVSFGDLLPVAVPAPVALEVKGETPLVWLTCPYVLGWVGIEAPRPDGAALAPESFRSRRVMLEHLRLDVRREGDADDVAEELARRVPGPWKLPLPDRLLILDDETFARLFAPDRPIVTELRTRVRLKGPWEKVVDEGALWIEEYLPRLTLLAGPYEVDASRLGPTEERALEILRRTPLVQLGAGGSVGFGVLTLEFEGELE